MHLVVEAIESRRHRKTISTGAVSCFRWPYIVSIGECLSSRLARKIHVRSREDPLGDAIDGHKLLGPELSCYRQSTIGNVACRTKVKCINQSINKSIKSTHYRSLLTWLLVSRFTTTRYGCIRPIYLSSKTDGGFSAINLMAMIRLAANNRCAVRGVTYRCSSDDGNARRSMYLPCKIKRERQYVHVRTFTFIRTVGPWCFSIFPGCLLWLVKYP